MSTNVSKTSAILRHPATKTAGVALSYLGTAVAGWWFGRRIERAVLARRAAEAQTQTNSYDGPRTGQSAVAQA